MTTMPAVAAGATAHTFANTNPAPSPTPTQKSDPSPTPDPTPTSPDNSNPPNLILDANKIGNQHGKATYRIKPGANVCQAVLNFNNQATGDDTEETGEQLSYRITKGNKKSLFNISKTGVLSFIPQENAFKKEIQILPLTISITSSKRPVPTATQVVVVIPAKANTKSTCDPKKFKPEEDGFRLLGGACDDTFKGRYSYTALHGKKGHDRLRGQGANDSLYGGLGHDTMLAGAGQDLLTATKATTS